MSKRNSFLFGLLTALTGFSLYQLRSRIFAQLYHLPPPRHKIIVHRNLSIPMRDGVFLKADHYAPRTSGSYPTLLVRTIYGRGSETGILGLSMSFPYARFAERGYHVLVQTTRGMFDSEGEFNPVFHETEDGLDTLAWIEDQPWFNGNLGTWGPSYLTHTQWALAAKAPPSLKAIMPAVMSSEIHELSYTDGIPNIEISLRWMMILAGVRALSPRGLRRNRKLINFPHQNRLLAKAIQNPLPQADRTLTGVTSPHYQNGLTHPAPTDPYWAPLHFRQTLPKVLASPFFLSGWYDMSLGGLLTDYTTLRNLGRNPYLTIGPWHHLDLDYQNELIREGLPWFESRLKGNHHALRQKPVRLYVMGENAWRELDTWPPAFIPTPYYLHPHAELGRTPAGGNHAPSTYHLDPADPTPVSGGARFSPDAGRKPQNTLEARPDVLTFTTPPLEQDLDVIGPVRATLYVRSSLPYADFIARLCDVTTQGISHNLCDGIFQLTPGKGEPQPDGTIKIEIDLWATANRFLKGHCLRLHIASAGLPRWPLNPGTGEPRPTATRFLPADQQIYHDETHPSHLLLPLLNT